MWFFFYYYFSQQHLFFVEQTSEWLNQPMWFTLLLQWNERCALPLQRPHSTLIPIEHDTPHNNPSQQLACGIEALFYTHLVFHKPHQANETASVIFFFFFFAVLFLKSDIRIICCDKNQNLCVFLSSAKQHGSKINVSVSLSVVLYYKQNNTLRRFSMSTTTYHTPYCITESSTTKEDVVQFASLLRPPSPPFPPPPCPPFASPPTSLLKTDVSQVSERLWVLLRFGFRAASMHWLVNGVPYPPPNTAEMGS